MIDLREVRSVTEFQRNLKEYVGQLKEKKTPLVLTVNGRAELVVQNAESYQALLDRLERAETLAAIRQGMEEFKRGEGIPLGKAANKQHRGLSTISTRSQTTSRSAAASSKRRSGSLA